MSADRYYYLRTVHGWGRTLSLDSDADAMDYAKLMATEHRFGVEVYEIDDHARVAQASRDQSNGSLRLVGEIS